MSGLNNRRDSKDKKVSRKVKSISFFSRLALLVSVLLIHLAHAEDWTILSGAIFDTSEDSAAAPSANAVDGAYNLGYTSDTTDNHSGVKEWRAEVPKNSKKIVSFFFQYRPDNKNNLGQA